MPMLVDRAWAGEGSGMRTGYLDRVLLLRQLPPEMHPIPLPLGRSTSPSKSSNTMTMWGVAVEG